MTDQLHRTDVFLHNGMLCIAREGSQALQDSYPLDPQHPPLVLCSDGTALRLVVTPSQVSGDGVAPDLETTPVWTVQAECYGCKFLAFTVDRVLAMPMAIRCWTVNPDPEDEDDEIVEHEGQGYPHATGILMQGHPLWICLVHEWTPVCGLEHDPRSGETIPRVYGGVS